MLVQLLLSRNLYHNLLDAYQNGHFCYVLKLWPKSTLFIEADAKLLQLQDWFDRDSGMCIFEVESINFLCTLMLNNGRGTAGISSREDLKIDPEESHMQVLPTGDLFILPVLRAWVSLLEFVRVCASDELLATTEFQEFADRLNSEFWRLVTQVVKPRKPGFIPETPEISLILGQGKNWLDHLDGYGPGFNESLFRTLSHAQQAKVYNSLDWSQLRMQLQEGDQGEDSLHLAATRWITFKNLVTAMSGRDPNNDMRGLRILHKLEVNVKQDFLREVRVADPDLIPNRDLMGDEYNLLGLQKRTEKWLRLRQQDDKSPLMDHSKQQMLNAALLILKWQLSLASQV